MDKHKFDYIYIYIYIYIYSNHWRYTDILLFLVGLMSG